MASVMRRSVISDEVTTLLACSSEVAMLSSFSLLRKEACDSQLPLSMVCATEALRMRARASPSCGRSLRRSSATRTASLCILAAM